MAKTKGAKSENKGNISTNCGLGLVTMLLGKPNNWMPRRTSNIPLC